MRLNSVLRCSIKHVQKVLKNDLNVVSEDKYVVHIRAGTGGHGIARYNGQGGKGGDVYVQAKADISFTDIKKNLAGSMKLKAQAGSPSQKTKLLGENGADTIFPVPLGVEVVDETRSVLLARCNRPFQRYLIARGGAGGHKGNNFKGEKGEELDVAFHLKLRPNIGLVGFPNAGKSTLLKAFVPRKSVKIAPYPFTTVKPQMAFWAAEKAETKLEDHFTLSIADLPGLIEGASRNRGKGYRFLKHLEYCDVLLFVIDSTGFQLSNNVDEPFRTVLETVALLNKELEEFDRRLVTKPAVLLMNKIDIAPNVEEVEALCAKLRRSGWENEVRAEIRPVNALRFDYVLPVSAKSGKIDDVKKTLIRLHKDLNPYLVPESNDENNKKYLL